MGAWTTKKVDLEIERLITTAAIVSKDFLKETLHLYNPRYFQSEYCALICRWCYEYYNTYQKAPGSHIQDIYLSYRSSPQRQPETSRLIAEFLRGLSEEFEGKDEPFNYKFVVDRAESYLRTRAVQVHLEQVGALIDEGELIKAEAAIIDYKRPAVVSSSGVNVLTDKEFIIAALAEREDSEEDVLFQFPGALGSLLGTFHRDDFIAVAGPMGRGKTWALQYFATQALLSNLNVAFFSMGDMTVKQMGRRIHKALTALPSKPGTILYPVWDCRDNQMGTCRLQERRGSGVLMTKSTMVDFEEAPHWVPCDVCYGQRRYLPAVWLEEHWVPEDLTWQRALRRGKALQLHTQGKLFLEAWPRKFGSVSDVEVTLELWAHQHGFVPDVIITDYADIMRDESGLRDYRHQLNAIWEAHDALAKRMHCLVVSATQTDRSTLGGKEVKGDKVSEDIRKLAHVSMMFALNQTPYEYKHRHMRVRLLKSRHEECDPSKECIVLQQLDVGAFHLDSRFR